MYRDNTWNQFQYNFLGKKKHTPDETGQKSENEKPMNLLPFD